MLRYILVHIGLVVGCFVFVILLGRVAPLLFGEITSLGWAAMYTLSGILFSALFILVSHPFAPRWMKRVEVGGITATAEVIENGYLAFRDHHRGSDFWVKIPVRVEADHEPEFEAKMVCKLSYGQLLKVGSRVTVKYDPKNPSRVMLFGTPDLSSLL
jgi:hypothetical protein